MAHDEMKDKTTALIAKGADMAAIFGGTAADAVDALSSALKGEMDPIERYGVSLNQAAIQTQMAADGTDKLTGAAQKQAQTNAILELITKQTADTQGQWAAQSGTAAEAQQILGAKVENLKAKIGEGLLPMFASAAVDLGQGAARVREADREGRAAVGHVRPRCPRSSRTRWCRPSRICASGFSDKAGPHLQDISRVIKDVVVPAFEKIWKFISDYVIPIFKTTLAPIIDGVKDVIPQTVGQDHREQGQVLRRSTTR
jgi:anti-sigma28 factor (negative regulator of flagellin synthesis)